MVTLGRDNYITNSITKCVGSSAKHQSASGSQWTMVFDGASNALGNRIGVVIVSPKHFHTPFTARLCFDCTNNMVDYEACIMGIKADIDMRIKFLNVYGDSTLVISHIKGEWDTKHPNLIPY